MGIQEKQFLSKKGVYGSFEKFFHKIVKSSKTNEIDERLKLSGVFTK